jgi:hypothetical protein
VAKTYGVPLILTVHGLDTRLLEPRSVRQRHALGELLKLIDKVVLVGEPLIEFFSSIAGRSDNFVVVPNGAGQSDHRKDTSGFDFGLTAFGYGREKGNTQLAIMEELGLIGLWLYGLLLASLFGHLARTFKRFQTRDDKVAFGIVTGAILGMTVNSVFEAW